MPAVQARVGAAPSTGTAIRRRPAGRSSGTAYLPELQECVVERAQVAGASCGNPVSLRQVLVQVDAGGAACDADPVTGDALATMRVAGAPRMLRATQSPRSAIRPRRTQLRDGVRGPRMGAKEDYVKWKRTSNAWAVASHAFSR